MSTKLALHVTELHTFADEHVLHTPFSTAPQGSSQPSAATPLVSKKLALHVTELHTAADEPVLHTPSSTAPHSASQPSAASTLVSKNLALNVTELHTTADEHCYTVRCPQHRKAPRDRQRHLCWCRRTWRCTSPSCTPLRMNPCCTLRCPQHRRAPHHRLQHLHWCRRSLRCTSPSCTQLRKSTAARSVVPSTARRLATVRGCHRHRPHSLQ